MGCPLTACNDETDFRDLEGVRGLEMEPITDHAEGVESPDTRIGIPRLDRRNSVAANEKPSVDDRLDAISRSFTT